MLDHKCFQFYLCFSFILFVLSRFSFGLDFALLSVGDLGGRGRKTLPILIVCSTFKKEKKKKKKERGKSASITVDSAFAHSIDFNESRSRYHFVLMHRYSDLGLTSNSHRLLILSYVPSPLTGWTPVFVLYLARVKE
jgi:hypothetical protein